MLGGENHQKMSVRIEMLQLEIIHKSKLPLTKSTKICKFGSIELDSLLFHRTIEISIIFLNKKIVNQKIQNLLYKTQIITTDRITVSGQNKIIK